MRFLANENFPLMSVRRLRSAGHDVAAIIEDMPGSRDTQVLLRAHEESRIIITFDRDYGELLYRQKLPKPAGVLYLRFDPLSPEEPAEFILHSLTVKGVELEGKFTVARRDRIRQRLL